jgi:hypothetical protein
MNGKKGYEPKSEEGAERECVVQIRGAEKLLACMAGQLIKKASFVVVEQHFR